MRQFPVLIALIALSLADHLLAVPSSAASPRSLDEEISKAMQQVATGWGKPEDCEDCGSTQACPNLRETMKAAYSEFQSEWENGGPMQRSQAVRKIVTEALPHANFMPADLYQVLKGGLGDDQHPLVQATTLHAMGRLARADSLCDRVITMVQDAEKGLLRVNRMENSILKKRIGGKTALEWVNLRQSPPKKRQAEEYLKVLEKLRDITVEGIEQGALYEGGIGALASMQQAEAMQMLLECAQNCPSWQNYGAVLFAAWRQDQRELWHAVIQKLESLEKQVQRHTRGSKTLGKECPRPPSSWKKSEREWRRQWNRLARKEAEELQSKVGSELNWINGIHHGMQAFSQGVGVTPPDGEPFDHATAWYGWLEKRFPADPADPEGKE